MLKNIVLGFFIFLYKNIIKCKGKKHYFNKKYGAGSSSMAISIDTKKRCSCGKYKNFYDYVHNEKFKLY